MLGVNKKGATSPASKKPSPDASKVSGTYPTREGGIEATSKMHCGIVCFCVHSALKQRGKSLPFKPASRLRLEWLLDLLWKF